MRLTVLSDYSLRVLMYLAARPDRLATIQEIARAYAISENHLMKVVHGLAKGGYIETVRGRGGGMRLAGPADGITVGAVLRTVEEDFAIVECLGNQDTCRITKACRLKRVLQLALAAFMAELDQWTLADLVSRPKALLDALDIEAR
ncbi:MAG: Rrf2 family transcriptional regulator [Hyphomicrobiaceae bacterium]|nr:Rrf2 family transcriptional regulator [Hyphomicrobiaceae bacterium]